MKMFSEDHRKALAVARLAISDRRRLSILAKIAERPNVKLSDTDLGKLIGLKPSMVSIHLRKLRESGMITVSVSRYRLGPNWIVRREIELTELGKEKLQNAIRQEQVGQQGSLR